MKNKTKSYCVTIPHEWNIEKFIGEHRYKSVGEFAREAMRLKMIELENKGDNK